MRSFPKERGGLFRRGAVAVAALQGRIRQRSCDPCQIGRNIAKSFPPADRPFVHIEGPAHLDLHGMALARRIAIMLGNEPPCIGLVALHVISLAAQLIFDDIDKIRGAARAKAIADDNIRPLRRCGCFCL